MSTEEVNAIFSLLDINKDGKLDYAEVSLCFTLCGVYLNIYLCLIFQNQY